MNAEYRGKMPLPHIIQECPAADSQARYTAKLILPLVWAELNNYPKSYSQFDLYLHILWAVSQPRPYKRFARYTVFDNGVASGELNR